MKCERCWRYVTEVSSDPASAGLCERCQDALAEGRSIGMSDQQRAIPREAAAEAHMPRRRSAARDLAAARHRRARSADESHRPATLPLHESVDGHPGLHGFHARAEHRRGVRHPERGRISRSRRCVIAVIATAALIGVGIYAASLAHHQLAGARRAGAHHRRRRRQPASIASPSARSSISSTSTGGRIISGRSTSPTRRSPSAWRS